MGRASQFAVALDMMRRLGRSIAYNLREGGLAQVGRKVLERGGRWLSFRESWLVYRQRLGPEQALGADRLVHRELSVRGMMDLGYFKAHAFPESMQARLDRGCICHGFLIREDLANVAWTESRRLELVESVALGVPHGSGIFDCLTLPAHRGKGVYPATLKFLMQWLFLNGDATALIAVDPGNRPSIAGIERAGFVQAGAVRRVIRLGREAVEVEGDALERLGP